jgi:hypothetical protein
MFSSQKISKIWIVSLLVVLTNAADETFIQSLDGSVDNIDEMRIHTDSFSEGKPIDLETLEVPEIKNRIDKDLSKFEDFNSLMAHPKAKDASGTPIDQQKNYWEKLQELTKKLKSDIFVGVEKRWNVLGNDVVIRRRIKIF